MPLARWSLFLVALMVYSSLTAGAALAADSYCLTGTADSGETVTFNLTAESDDGSFTGNVSGSLETKPTSGDSSTYAVSGASYSPSDLGLSQSISLSAFGSVDSEYGSIFVSLILYFSPGTSGNTLNSASFTVGSIGSYGEASTTMSGTAAVCP